MSGPRKPLPSPRCCTDGARFIALRCSMDMIYSEHESTEAALAADQETPPTWQLILKDQVGNTEVATILCCPFCGTPVPPIRLRARPPKAVCLVIDGGYYCATCEKRLNECRCANPARLWEIAPRTKVSR